MYQINDRIPQSQLKELRSAMPTNRKEFLDLLEIHYNLKIVPAFPLKVSLELTSYCNLKCVMCKRTYMERKPSHMEEALARRLIDECSAEGAYYMALQGYGESLMHPQVVDIIRYAAGAGIPVTSLVTNGLLFDEEKAEALLGTGLSTVTVSLDGVSASMYQHLRQADKFETVRECVRLLSRTRERLGTETFLQVNTLVTEGTPLEECEAFKEEMSSYVDYVHISQPLPWVSPEVESSRPGVFVPGLHVNDVPCPQIWKHLVVLSNGVVTMCCVDEEGGLRVGSAAEQTLTEIWHGPQAQYIRNKHIQADMSGLDPCSKCVGWHPLSYSTRPPEGDVVGTLLERIPIELE